MRVVKLNDGTIGKVITGQYDKTKGVELFYPARQGCYNEAELQQLNNLEYTEGIQEDYISYIEQDYSFGDVIKTHIIGEYQIIESVKEDGEKHFSPYINYDRIRMSYATLDQAITGVICYKYDGANSQANKFLWKMIG
jgi:hypothetical protein